MGKRPRTRREALPFLPSVSFISAILLPAAFLTSCGAAEDAREAWDDARGHPEDTPADPAQAEATASFVFRRAGDLTHVTDGRGAWKATFTKDARTVTLAGPRRTFAEATARDSVSHSTWVRLLPVAHEGSPDSRWLVAALAANAKGTRDLLAIGMEYVAGAKPKYDSRGRRYAGDASYGPRGEDGVRQLGSDVDDYLRTVSEALRDSRERARASSETRLEDEIRQEFLARRQSLDCSGYIRMIFGYRDSFEGGGYRLPFALTRALAAKDATVLPRTAEDLFMEGPGVALIEDEGTQVTRFEALRPGDAVFFQADPEREARLDHVGVYLGADEAGRHRFLSSRKSADGPTLGDVRGSSLLDGTGLYARSFRSARRF
jgi:hypothetical protein